MGKLIRKFGHVIAGALVAWFAYGALEAGGAKLKDKVKLPRISAAALPLRAEDETAPEFGDPFQSEHKPYGPDYSSEAIAEKNRKLREEEKRRVFEARKRAQKKKETKKETGFRPFTLLLESVLALPDGGVARISGHTLRVGDSIPGMDEDKPPILVSVKGSVAEVAYRGARYSLSITGKRVQRVTERPDAPKKKPAEAPAKPEAAEPVKAAAQPDAKVASPPASDVSG